MDNNKVIEIKIPTELLEEICAVAIKQHIKKVRSQKESF
jgi:hypothetical protein